ncbi:esterase/lipase family protein [Rhodopseudomonas palustris]|uniref:Alpha/beta hydrolase n=1 Tax=Rhodopseudomonas palustris (strain BisB18) TaxID=316056 RepID=Q218H0_RHOPB
MPDPAPSTPPLRPPSLGLLLAEARSLLELNASLLLAPLLMQAPKGDGHPVLVLPGLLASDLSTALLRRFLKHLGYHSFAWGLGRNIGGVYGMRAKLDERLRRIHDLTGRKVSLVGWSLGGVYARDLALHRPELVRNVITLGSPFARDLTATNGRWVYERLSGESLDNVAAADLQALAGALPVPTTSIYSRGDGIVNWRTSVLQPSATAENIEVCLASHIGLTVNAAVLWAVADRLAQPEGTFRPFERGGPFAIAYARPQPAK